MNDQQCNFEQKIQCEQGGYEVLNIEHIYSCTKRNNQKIPIKKYENILKGTMNQKKTEENTGKQLNRN